MKQHVVDIHEAKAHFSRLLELAHAGQEVVLAKAGKPYARLVPLAADTASRRPGRLAGLKVEATFFDPLPAQELAAWEKAAR